MLGAYNVWMDAGDRLLSTRQTSLVVDPPDGRVPVKAWAAADRESSVKTALFAADSGTTTPEYGMVLPRSNGVIEAFVQTPCRSGRPSGLRGIVPSESGVWPRPGL